MFLDYKMQLSALAGSPLIIDSQKKSISAVHLLDGLFVCSFVCLFVDLCVCLLPVKDSQSESIIQPGGGGGGG